MMFPCHVKKLWRKETDEWFSGGRVVAPSGLKHDGNWERTAWEDDSRHSGGTTERTFWQQRGRKAENRLLDSEICTDAIKGSADGEDLMWSISLEKDTERVSEMMASRILLLMNLPHHRRN
nr:uncharacterized protein LOC123289216 isoform X7 [Equus asinus]